ncbi:hypothetical protein OH76DRAFT_1416442 [Lentinus brumalis]|uniref:Uncharacterized protein n=1 Tax=Lentinus brumalis TaxID=2498619 RepID=A0A371DJR1_9APHY|nr:hypothetical protein OH76DRAFT_1416442 [Polyporus brumalis]
MPPPKAASRNASRTLTRHVPLLLDGFRRHSVDFWAFAACLLTAPSGFPGRAHLCTASARSQHELHPLCAATCEYASAKYQPAADSSSLATPDGADASSRMRVAACLNDKAISTRTYYPGNPRASARAVTHRDVSLLTVAGLKSDCRGDESAERSGQTLGGGSNLYRRAPVAALDMEDMFNVHCTFEAKDDPTGDSVEASIEDVSTDKSREESGVGSRESGVGSRESGVGTPR